VKIDRTSLSRWNNNSPLSSLANLFIPYGLLFFWIFLLLIACSSQQSLIAHDEGLYATRARLMFDLGNWISPWTSAHHKTPGVYWLIAICYYFFGIDEFAVRLPSAIFSIVCVFLVYEIGSIVLDRRTAFFAALILPLQFLWFQYSRLANPDFPAIALILTSILCLLKAENSPRNRWLYIAAGSCFSLAILFRGFMVFVPAIAILPYLILENRRHRHLDNLFLYIGLIIGFLPTLFWFIASWLRYGSETWTALFGLVTTLESENRHNHGFFYYFWNLPALSFPWSILALIGIFIYWQFGYKKYINITIVFPGIIFLILSFFSTRLPHYSLWLYPFIALQAGIAGNFLLKIDKQQLSKLRLLLPIIVYSFGCLGLVLSVAGIGFLLKSPPESNWQKYAVVALILGIFWSSLPGIWWWRDRRPVESGYRASVALKRERAINYLMAMFFLGIWLALMAVGAIGLVGNYNPDIKNFVEKQEIAKVLAKNPIYLVSREGKTKILLSFYTPNLKRDITDIKELPKHSYAWVLSSEIKNSWRSYRSLGQIRDWELIEIVQ
jgi:4-amino-4-deoxy-L-arabinose transferase-like glycosyltransferase